MSQTLNTIYIGIGSNIEPKANIAAILPHLRLMLGNFELSPTYQTKAVGFDGADFWNLVAKGSTFLDLEQTISHLKQLEIAGGRIADATKYSGRTIDLDLLFFNDWVCQEPVELPRIDVVSQHFVLKPLADISPNLIHPVCNETIASLWHKMAMANPVFSRIDIDWLTLC